jgi:hypothetical protein
MFTKLAAQEYSKAAVTGLTLGILAIVLRLGAQIAALGRHGYYSGEVTILGIPVGFLQYDRTGVSLTQKSWLELSLPIACAVLAIAIVVVLRLYRKGKA